MKRKKTNKDGDHIYSDTPFGKGRFTEEAEQIVGTIVVPYEEHIDLVDGKYVAHYFDIPLISKEIRREGGLELKFYIEFIKTYKEQFEKKFHRYHCLKSSDCLLISGIFSSGISMKDVKIAIRNAFAAKHFTYGKASLGLICRRLTEYLQCDFDRICVAEGISVYNDMDV